MKKQETYANYMAGYETCADCSHCNNNYCDIYGRVNPNSPACPEFEER